MILTEAAEKTMQAIAVDGEGEDARLVLTEVARPVVGTGQVLVRVAAASVNRPDIQQRRGLYPPPPDASPRLGLDIAGTVVAAADDVVSPRVGDRVCALVNGGGYAEYCLAPAGQCLPVPRGLDLVEAASLPEAFFTAWNALMILGRLEAGEGLLIQGGASGVGLAAIQLAARLRGARIVATASSVEKRAACLAAGADHVLDYRDPEWLQQVRALLPGGCDVVVDAQAGPTTAGLLDLLAEGGRVVLLASHAGRTGEIDTRSLVRRRQTLTGATLRPRSAGFKAELAAALKAHAWPLLESGQVTTRIFATFPLDRAADAHALLDANRQIGKVVLIVDPDQLT